MLEDSRKKVTQGNPKEKNEKANAIGQRFCGNANCKKPLAKTHKFKYCNACFESYNKKKKENEKEKKEKSEKEEKKDESEKASEKKRTEVKTVLIGAVTNRPSPLLNALKKIDCRWYLDCGATSHVTGARPLLHNQEEDRSS